MLPAATMTAWRAAAASRSSCSREPCRPDDVNEAGLRGNLRVDHRGSRRREVEDRAGLGEDVERVLAHEDAVRRLPERLTEIPADPRMTGPLGDAGEPRGRALVDGGDQHPAHPPGRAHHRDRYLLHHARLLR
jgi:hypothetical protein